MDFTAIDVETANPNLASICQIGVVQFREGKIANRWKTLVNPQDDCDPINVAVHGIDESAAESSPTFSDVKPELDRLVHSSVVCCHTAFDRRAIAAVHARFQLVPSPWKWLDTSRVVRRAWPDRARAGYGLRPVAEMLGISFRHHDAEEDARAAGEILLRAIAHTGVSLMEWLERIELPLDQAHPLAGSATASHVRNGNPDGRLFGETLVFTGSLSLPRRHAAALAAEAGCDVRENVTPKTTILVVGDQDIKATHGHEKSAKHRKAEELIAKGQDLRILQESDFRDLLTCSP
jgi:DNA polymerase-3 subunit epsilon